MKKQKKVTKKVTTIDGLARLMQGEFTDVRQEMREGFADVRGEIREGFADVRGDIAVIKEDVRVLRVDVDGLKEQMRLLFTKIDELITMYRDTKQELAVLAKQVQRLEARVAELEGKKR